VRCPTRKTVGFHGRERCRTEICFLITAQDDICNTGVEEPFKQCILPTEDECSECEQIIGWAPSVHPNLDPEILWEKWSSTIILSRDADLRLLRNYPSRPLKRSRLRGPHQGGSQLLVYLAHHLGVRQLQFPLSLLACFLGQYLVAQGVATGNAADPSHLEDSHPS